VIGILIALQVNNWNEQRKKEAMEQRYLERLIQDLAGDLNEISNSARANKSREERLRFLLRTLDNPSSVGNDHTYLCPVKNSKYCLIHTESIHGCQFNLR
jgi:hypothetical protein